MKYLKEKQFKKLKTRLLAHMEHTLKTNGNAGKPEFQGREELLEKVKATTNMKQLRELWDDDDALRGLME